MSIQGRWKLVVKSPMGDQRFTAVLAEQDGAVTGTLTNDGNGLTADVFEGRAAGPDAEFKITLRQMRMTLAFAVAVTDGEPDGKVKAGMFGKFAVHGTRAD